MSADIDREGPRRGSSQKTMLSKALQKANTAVLLDNATNYEGAIEAYTDACELLQQVMHRSGGDDEKQKLEEIRNTYTIRIKELGKMGVVSQSLDTKALPDPPSSDEADQFSPGIEARSGPEDEDDEMSGVRTATATAVRVGNDITYMTEAGEPRSLSPSQIPPRRQSLLPSAFDEEVRFAKSAASANNPQDPSRFNAPKKNHNQSSLDMSSSSDRDSSDQYPSSARKQMPSTTNNQISDPTAKQLPSTSTPFFQNPHSRDASNGSTSWLDTIDESGDSSSDSSSIRSRSSLLYVRPDHARSGSADTEAEFGAALDAAVEAAYDEGLEPASDTDSEDIDDVVSNAKRNVELAKQRVREAQMESEAALARDREKRRIQEEALHGRFDALDSNYEDDEAEEEERILEEMMADFEFDLQSKSALPRKSDSSGLSGHSSGFSGRTWDSLATSNLTTTGTSLYTLPEDVDDQNRKSRIKIDNTLHNPPPQPPPATALPSLPDTRPSTAMSSFSSHSIGTGTPTGMSVRDRRLNSQNLKNLSINTNASLPPNAEAPRTVPPSMLLAHPTSPIPNIEPKTSVPFTLSGGRELKSEQQAPGMNMPHGKSDSTEPISIESAPTPNLSKVLTQEYDDSETASPLPPHMLARVPSGPNNHLKKNVSSTSLKGLKNRNMSVSTPDSSAQSPDTPSRGSFPIFDGKKSQTPFLPVLPASAGGMAAASHLITGGGLNLFDSSLNSPTSAISPNMSMPSAPTPLEPCPQSFLLRPFWLMRCLYQTIAHHRGGYISTKLFIPKDVWRVQNVKIRAIEEKISSCDLLTAALLKLAQVDTYDADAVLEEMQSFENILDQVQSVLTKKLGSDVGVQGSMSLFKSVNMEEASTTHEHPSSKSHGGAGKSYLTSWRKLRSKSSGTTTMPSASGIRDGGGSKDNLILNSLPMGDSPGLYAPGRIPPQLQCTGPNANYMSALGRLFDAAQVLDQIARQVEDPGLRHTSQTLVGLELSTRHAAEFFGFYICRFALNDIGLMIDKYIKRGTEWVMV